MHRLAAALFCLLLLMPVAARAQSPRHPSRHPQPASSPASLLPLTPAQRINSLISHMLAAWQVGDVSLLHHYYADDIAVVSGLDQPVIQGWRNFVAGYRAQHKRVESGQIVRRNTFVRVDGDVAWASYQWEYSGLVDGRAADFRGHTTLVFERRGSAWLIVFNHTSLDASQRAAGLPRAGR